ncbi:MAG: type II toxin-antitoxin system Phd/YefM family antitoxin [Nitrospira sp.]|nr:MAG: type II toxin-antitoxin system Phd/YefM family antitoxin [Nitrospira sp.]
MRKDIPISEARHELTSLPERLTKEPGAIAVTRRGKPVLAVMPWDLYQSLAETLEIMGDEDLMAALRKSIKEVEEGKVLLWKQSRIAASEKRFGTELTALLKSRRNKANL